MKSTADVREYPKLLIRESKFKKSQPILQLLRLEIWAFLIYKFRFFFQKILKTWYYFYYNRCPSYKKWRWRNPLPTDGGRDPPWCHSGERSLRGRRLLQEGQRWSYLVPLQRLGGNQDPVSKCSQEGPQRRIHFRLLKSRDRLKSGPR